MRRGTRCGILPGRLGLRPMNCAASITWGSSSRLHIGQKIKLPSYANKLADESFGPSKPDSPLTPIRRYPLQTQSVVQSGGNLRHTVRSGDTIWDIARKYQYQTGRDSLANGLGRGSRIHVGQELRRDRRPSASSRSCIMRSRTAIRCPHRPAIRYNYHPHHCGQSERGSPATSNRRQNPNFHAVRAVHGQTSRHSHWSHHCHLGRHGARHLRCWGLSAP